MIGDPRPPTARRFGTSQNVTVGVLISALIVTGVAAFIANRPLSNSPQTAASASATATTSPTPPLVPKGNDWTHYRFDLSGTGNNPEGLINSTNVSRLKQAWTWDAPDTLASTPAVVGRTIYIPSG